MHITHFSHPHDGAYATLQHLTNLRRKFETYGFMESFAHELIANAVSIPLRLAKVEYLCELLAGDMDWAEFRQGCKQATRYRREALVTGNLTPLDIWQLNEYQRSVERKVTTDPWEALFGS